jgi:uncharacterized SAM-binding protein YcdF (DUF218 family)
MTYLHPLLLVLLLITTAGVIRLKPCKGWWIPMLGALGLFVISWPPIDWLFSQSLEAWYTPGSLPARPAEAIVVLSSSVDPPRRERPYPLPDRYTYARCEFAAWLYKTWRPVPVLACGGGAPPVSATMRVLLQRAGVPDHMIWTEDRSGSTYENAVYGSRILQKNGIHSIALVVEAQSMLRAEACFRRQGMTVAPAPCRFRDFGPLRDELIPDGQVIARNEVTLHEVLGLGWYKLRGWI